MVALTVVLAAPLGAGLFGAVYAAGMALAVVLLWAFTLRLLGRPSTATAWALFKVTGPCLALVLAAAVIDVLV
jgi:heme O synthase-like polyprenyltransferase